MDFEFRDINTDALVTKALQIALIVIIVLIIMAVVKRLINRMVSSKLHRIREESPEETVKLARNRFRESMQRHHQ